MSESFVLQETEDLRQRHALLAGLADRTRGVLVVTVTPGGRGLHWLVRDIEAALGKREGTSGGARNAQERLGLLQVWGAAEQVRHVVVRRADLLAAAGWAHLAELCCLWSATLWLSVQGATPSRAQRDAMTVWNMSGVKWWQFHARWADAWKTPPAAAPSSPAPLPCLPTEHFMRWRASCQTVLGPADFAFVDELLRDHAARAARRMGSCDDTPERMCGELRDAVAATWRREELQIVLTAWQIAAFRAGWLLAGDADTLMAGQSPARQLVLDSELAERLREYTHPRFPALAALWICGCDTPQDLASLQVGDVADDASDVLCGAKRVAIPQPARPLLRAARVLREAQGAQAGDPLFAQAAEEADGRTAITSRAVVRCLRAVAREQGLPLMREYTRGASETAAVWARRNKVRFTQLTATTSAAAS